jgi:hypothetical protein
MTAEEIQQEEARREEKSKWTGRFSFIASLTESVIAFLYLLLLTFGGRVPHSPNVEFNIVDDMEFVLWLLLPIPLLILFISGFILGIIGRRSLLGIAGLGLAVISPIWQGIWLIYAVSAH